MVTQFAILENDLKNNFVPGLDSCRHQESEVLNITIGPNSYRKTIYVKFQIIDGIMFTFSATYTDEIEKLFIGEKENFSITEFIKKYNLHLSSFKGNPASKQMAENINLMKNNKALSNNLKGKYWPDIVFGEMK